MRLPLEQSRPREISAGRYEFGWGASPNAAISKGPTKHNYATTTINPALIAIVVVLGSALLVVSCPDSHCYSSRKRFTGGKLLQDFFQVLQSFSMETFFQEET